MIDNPMVVFILKIKKLHREIFHQKICNFDNQLILCHGIAGTGKTYVSIYKALQDVLRRGTPYEKLIIINPTVDVGNEDKLGFLPGELSAKIQQYNESTFTILDKIIGKTRAGKMINDNKKILLSAEALKHCTNLFVSLAIECNKNFSKENAELISDMGQDIETK